MATTYREHLLFGATLSLLAYVLMRNYLTFSIGAVIATCFFILLGAIFPDVDHRGSVAHKLVSSFVVLGLMGGAALLAAPRLWLMALSAGLSGLGGYLFLDSIKPKHRGATHSFPAAFIFAGSVAIITIFFFNTFVPASFAFTAYLSHLILDGTLFKR